MAIEDFTTYTEVDPNGKLTVTSSKAEGVDVDSDENVYLYKDKDPDHFDALDIDFELYIASTSQIDGRAGVAIVNTIGNANDFASTDIFCGITRSSGILWRLLLTRGAHIASDMYDCSADTLYYCTLLRTAGSDTVTVRIYSDSARTNLLDTLSLASFGTTKYRYVYGFVNTQVFGGGTDFDGYVQNLDLKEFFLQAVGSGAIAIAGALGLKTKISLGGGSVSLAGSLSTIKRFIQAVGSGSIGIVGTLGLKIKLAVGEGTIATVGTLSRFIKTTVGDGAVAITGALSSILTHFVNVGSGSVSIAGSLGRKILIGVGSGSIAVAGTLSSIKRFIQNVGGGSVAITGIVSFTHKAYRLIKAFIGRSLSDPTTHRDLSDDNDEWRKLQ